MNLEPNIRMQEGAEQHAEAHRYLEVCGVFFYPDRRFALGREKPTVARFVPITNSHEPAVERDRYFAFEFIDLEAAIVAEYGGVPSGFVQLFHSHLRDVGPSPDDFEMVTAFAAGLLDHPLWTPTATHKIYAVPSQRWVTYRAAYAESVAR